MTDRGLCPGACFCQATANAAAPSALIPSRRLPASCSRASSVPVHRGRRLRRDLQDRVRPAGAARHDGSGRAKRRPPGRCSTDCARLMTYSDRAGARGFAWCPRSPPRRRGCRRTETYTFSLRRGFRFSDGKPVDARAFARAIEPHAGAGPQVLGTRYMQDIVGARAVEAGKAASAEGVVARGLPPDDPPGATRRRLAAGRACRSSAPCRRISRPTRGPRSVPGWPVLRLGVPPRPAGHPDRNRYYRGTGRTTSTGSASISPAHRPPTSSTGSRTGAPTGGSSRLRSTSPRAGSHSEVRHRQVAVLRPPRLHAPGVHAQHVQPAVSRQSRPEARGELRRRPDGLHRRRSGAKITDQFLPPTCRASRTRASTARRSGSREGESTGEREPAERQGDLYVADLPLTLALARC